MGYFNNLEDTSLLFMGFYTTTPSLSGYLSMKDIVSLTLSSKQPILQVVVSLQRCLRYAKAEFFLFSLSEGKSGHDLKPRQL